VTSTYRPRPRTGAEQLCSPRLACTVQLILALRLVYASDPYTLQPSTLASRAAHYTSSHARAICSVLSSTHPLPPLAQPPLALLQLALPSASFTPRPLALLSVGARSSSALAPSAFAPSAFAPRLLAPRLLAVMHAPYAVMHAPPRHPMRLRL
jgi:hypothetical protein